MNPIVPHAQILPFEPNQSLISPKVESRCFMWVRSGEGSIALDDEVYDLKRGQFLFSRWGARIARHACNRNPFIVGEVHFVPHQSPEKPFFLGVNHHAPVKHFPGREDRPLAWAEGNQTGIFLNRPVLEDAAEYIVKTFSFEYPDFKKATILASLFMLEFQAYLRTPSFITSETMPAGLKNAMIHLHQNIGSEIEITLLSRVAGYETSYFVKLFKKHFTQTPSDYLKDKRIQLAKQLLETTCHKISEIGQQVGYPDPYYFSRVFKAKTGMTASEYRNRKS